MRRVTLIGERIARVGEAFVFVGPQPECRDCRLKTACLQLDRGRLYRIVKTRDVHHEDECRYHEDGVRVVEVEAAQITASLKSRLAVEGSTVEHSRPICSNLECGNFLLCHPPGLSVPTKAKILQVGEALECPLGYDLRRVEVAYS